MPGINIRTRFKYDQFAYLQKVLPHDNGKKTKDHSVERSCDCDDYAADFIVSHEVLAAEPSVDVDLPTSESCTRKCNENREKDSSRYTVKQINQGNRA
jgi:hypothetical protein